MKSLPTQVIEVDSEEMIVETSSGNVFADLGLPNAGELQLKADLAVQIIRAIRERALTQHQAATVVGLKQPDISNICNARLDGISVERLFLVLNRLGRSIEIHVSQEEREGAGTLVLAA